MEKNNTSGYQQLVWDRLSEPQRAAAMSMGEDYKDFLNAGKTERLCVREIVRRAEERGFVALDSVSSLQPGDKVYRMNRGKAVFLAVIGQAACQKTSQNPTFLV